MIAHDRRPTSIVLDNSTLWHRIHRVVSALAVHVWTQLPKQGADGRFSKHNHVVHYAERSHELGPICGRQQWSTWTFQSADKVIVVDSNHQHVRFASGGL
jgi:hypothetical protein